MIDPNEKNGTNAVEFEAQNRAGRRAWISVFEVIFIDPDLSLDRHLRGSIRV